MHGAPPAFDYTKNIVTDYGATCNGDYATATRVASIAFLSKNLSVTVNLFDSSFVGKTLLIPGAGAGEGLTAKIVTVTDAQNVVLDLQASATVSSQSVLLEWGTDDAVSFGNFNVFVRAQGAARGKLIIPTGRQCQFLSSGIVTGGQGNQFVDGAQNLVVYGYGAKISSPFHDAAFFYLGAIGTLCHNGITDAGGCTARVNSASKGATSVTLTAASLAAGYASRVTVGNYMIVTGFDTQGVWKPSGGGFGYPPNLYYYDYVIVTNINAGTGVVSFDRPLKYSYLSTWPLYCFGGPGESDCGGPATIYALTSNFNLTVEFQGLTIYQRSQQTQSSGVSATFRDVTMLAGDASLACAFPTLNINWIVINSDFSQCQIEVDKIVDQVVLTNSSFHIIENQSATPNKITTSGLTVTSMNGTPKNWFDTGSTFATIHAGVEVQGFTTEINLTNTSFGLIDSTTAQYTGGVGNPGVNSLTMSGGQITIPNTQGAMFWAVPGANNFWTGALQIGLFRVTGVTQDATNTYVQTNLTGTYPAFSAGLLNGGKLNLTQHPALKFTCTGCTGSVQATNLNSAPAGAPLFSYYKETFDGSASGPWPPNSGTQVGFPVFGNFVSASYNVTKNYTGGAGAISFLPTGQFVYTTVVPSTLTSFNYDPSLLLTAPVANRVTTCTGPTTCSTIGTQSGDTPSTPAENVWWTGLISPFIGANIAAECISTPSVCPSLTATITTDQGVVLPP